MRGQAHLLDDLHALEDLERVRLLFDDLEEKRGVADLLGRADKAEGMRIFIGSENKLFSLSGSSTIVSPYRDGQGRIVGVLGVIGPTRLNYARIIPMVDYTAKVVSKVLGGCDHEGLIFAASALISGAKFDCLNEWTRMTDTTAGAPDAPETAPQAEAALDPVAVLAKEAADLKDRLLRTLAEMENLRRRTEREVADARVYGGRRLSRATSWRSPTTWNAP